MQDVQTLFDDYAAYHQTSGNKVTHRVGIPMIMLGLFGMLTYAPLFTLATVRFDAAMLLIALACAYYFVIEWRLAVAMIVISIIFYSGGAMLPLMWNAALFVAGWILQFIGHSMYERRSPAFSRNLIHVLIGPLWIMNDMLHVVRKAPRMS